MKKYCDDPDHCTYSDCPTAFCDRWMDYPMAHVAGSENIKLEHGTTFTAPRIKEDSRPPLGLWAPGRYLKTCFKCLHAFIGDKRSMWCADCAYGIHQTNPC